MSGASGRSRPHKQRYRKEWEEEFKWLRAAKGNDLRAFCIACKQEMVSDVGVIKNHGKGIKHNKLVKCIATNQPKIDEKFKSSTDSPMADKIKSFEIWMASYFTEHNISFNASNHLINGLKTHLTDPVCQGATFGRTKATAIVNNVVGKCSQEELVQILRNTKFSVLIDESTDRGTIKSLCVCVRYFSNKTYGIQTRFLSLVQVFSKDQPDEANVGATADRLYRSFNDLLGEMEIPKSNLIGFASDGCNTMMGSKNSVSSRLKIDYPGITILKCICHSLHLCCSKSCEELPRICEDLAREVYGFFKNSSKRQCQFAEFQMFCDVEPQKILRPSQTRWLSLQSVIKRLLEQWNPLKLFFTSQWQVHKTHASEHIYIGLNNPVIKMYYLFLSWILSKVVALNEHFQTEKVILPDLHNNMTQMYKDILRSYMNNNYINKTDIDKIDPNDERNFIDLKQMYLGVGVLQFKNDNTIIDSELLDFHIRCRRFLIKLCSEIKSRYDFEEAILSKLSLFSPKSNEVVNTLFHIYNMFPRVAEDFDLQILDNEWQMYISNKNSLPEEVKEIKDADTFWFQLGKLKDLNDKLYYKNISKFVLDIFCLPHSNAACERIFSKVNLIKTDSRNRLLTKTMSNIILASEAVKESGGCDKFEPTRQMINSMTSRNLYSNKDEENYIDVVFD